MDFILCKQMQVNLPMHNSEKQAKEKSKKSIQKEKQMVSRIESAQVHQL